MEPGRGRREREVTELWVEGDKSEPEESGSDSFELASEYSGVWSVSIAASNALLFLLLEDDI